MEGEQASVPTVTVVLPAFNESSCIVPEMQRICDSLDRSDLSYELLVINDGSTDDTADLVNEFAERHECVRAVHFRRNGGAGTARRIGTQQARGDIVVWTDADMTYPNDEIPALVSYLLENDDVDQVVGARTSEEGRYRLLRVPAKWFVRRIAEALSGTRIPDLNSGFRAFHRQIALPYLRLLPPGFSCVTTITLAFLLNQHTVEYVPISYAARSGRSKFHPFKDAYRYMLQVLRMIMYFNPLKLLMPVALGTLGIGVLKVGYDLIVHDGRITGSTLLIFLIGMQIGALALIADLVVRSRDV